MKEGWSWGEQEQQSHRHNVMYGYVRGQKHMLQHGALWIEVFETFVCQTQHALACPHLTA